MSPAVGPIKNRAQPVVSSTTRKKKAVDRAKSEAPSNMDMEPQEISLSDMESLLHRARSQLQLGDWESLVSLLDQDTVQKHPDRAKLALLAASAYMQQGDFLQAARFVRQAQKWGCGTRLASQLLVASVYNTLGCVSVIMRKELKALEHFKTSISLVFPSGDIQLLIKSRMVRETVRRGLLPQAVRLAGEELKVIKNAPCLSFSRLRIFETELELLNHELSLAQQRNQIFVAGRSAAIMNSSLEGSEASEQSAREGSVSQLGQDVWVLSKSDYKRDGYFVEFGATDGVLLSNTWLLEKSFGWRGLCAEPNPKFFEKLKSNRQCVVTNHCISGETGKTVEFVFADAYGGSQEYANDDQHAAKRAAYRAAGRVETLVTISLNDFLERYGAPRQIDYISIDTEGSEFEILRAFPFDRWCVLFWTIEHNFTDRRADIRKLMENNGYLCTERQWDDWYEKKA